MRQFSIEARPDLPDQPGPRAKITIGGFSELIGMPLDFWEQDQYERQWRQAVFDIVSGKKNKTCLFTSMFDLSEDCLIWTWTMHREGGTVFFQNQTWPLDLFRAQIDIEHPENFVGDRITHLSDGSRSSLKNFLGV